MFKSLLAALAVTLALATTASADVTRSGNTFTQTPAVCSCLTTIDGYVFAGMPYYDATPAVDSAVEAWWQLEADPNYASLPPVTSISVDTTVSGTVEDPPATEDPDAPTDPDARSSWGRGDQR